MDITLSLEKSIEENASFYFDKAKKMRKKIEGAQEALEKSEQKLEQLKKKQSKELVEKQEEQAHKDRKKEWYEKFRWFRSSEGLLVIGGRDATTNEIVIKKHTDATDLVFHTDMAGSPFFVVKSEGKKIGKATIQEAADATVSFSKAWKLGLSTAEVFHVTPEQVSKKAQAGESLTKGAFMIYGDTTYVDVTVNCAIGMINGQLMCGPVTAVEKHCKEKLIVLQGDEKPSVIAKKVKHKLGGTVDDIIRVLPSGGLRLKK